MHINFSNNNVIYACVTQDEKSFVAVIPRSTVKFVTGHFLPLILRLGQVASKNAHKRDSQLPRFLPITESIHIDVHITLIAK